MTTSNASPSAHPAIAAVTEPSEPSAAIGFLLAAASYFEHRPTGGEDSAHWSNVMNAENCRRAAALIKHLWKQS